MIETPEYIAATAAIYDALDRASAAKRAAMQANDRPAYDLAQAAYSALQDDLRKAEKGLSA